MKFFDNIWYDLVWFYLSHHHFSLWAICHIVNCCRSFIWYFDVFQFDGIFVSDSFTMRGHHHRSFTNPCFLFFLKKTINIRTVCHFICVHEWQWCFLNFVFEFVLPLFFQLKFWIRKQIHCWSFKCYLSTIKWISSTVYFNVNFWLIAGKFEHFQKRYVWSRSVWFTNTFAIHLVGPLCVWNLIKYCVGVLCQILKWN